MGDAFDSATYYDCDDSAEKLSHTTPEEAIEEYVNNHWDKSRSDEENFEDFEPITVHAWQRDLVSASELTQYARWAAEAFCETFNENHGGEDVDGLSDLADEIAAGFAEVVKKLVKPDHVWQCHLVGSREYSAAEIAKAVA